MGKVHNLLCAQSRHYHNWHHTRYHKHIHFATLGLYILTIAAVITQQFAPIATYAASGAWNLNTSTDYTYDNAKVEFSGGSAQLKGAGTPGTDWIAVSGGNNWGYRKAITIDNSAGGALTDYQVKIDEGLVGRWKMDETSGTSVADSSGNSNTGTATGTTIVDSQTNYGKARSFNGTSDYVDVGNPTVLQLGQGAGKQITVSVWYYAQGTSTAPQGIVSKRTNGSDNSDYMIYTENNFIIWGTGSSGDPGAWWGVAAEPSRNVWHHVVGTLTATGNQTGNKSFYIDGVNVSNTTYTMKAASVSDSLKIGSVQTGSYYFFGLIDETRIYNRALSASEITSLYTSNKSGYLGTAYDHSIETGDDLRFTDSDGVTALNYWLENYTASGQNGKIWVKVPSISAATTKTIYLYYGNASGSPGSSGANTFAFFDDFGNATTTNTNWTSTGTGFTVTGGYLYHSNDLEPTNNWPTFTINSSSAFANGVVDVKMKPTSCGISYGKGITARYTDDNNQFISGLEIWASANSIDIVRRVSSTWGLISGNVSGSLGCNISIWSDVSFSLSGSSLKSTINGTILTGTDSSFSSGKVGVFVDNRETPTGAWFDNFRVRAYAASEPTVSASGVGAEVGPLYPVDNPTVVNNTAQGYTTLSAFAQTLGSGSSGNIKYQISNNGGTTWYWWNASAWATTATGYTESNTASDINTNLATFTAGSAPKTFKWKAYLNSDGLQQPKLDNLVLTYVWDTVAPPNPTLSSKLNASGGATTLTSATWYNYSAPYFAWSAPSDLAGEGESVSGVAGYYIYFGADATADPYTAGTWQTGTTYTAGSLTSGSTYYLLVKTQDNAGNRSSSANLFTYKYDAIVPTNPSVISVSPSGYSSANAYTFLWSSSGASAAGDTGGSGLSGYQYKTGASSGVYSNWSSTITGTSVTLTTTPAYQEGANTFQLRAVDIAGNVASSAITATFYYAGNAPSAPQNVTVSPATSEGSPSVTNSFSFSWGAPATFNGSISQYHYSVNTLPTNTNTTATASSSLTASSFATQQGKNTLYVVAKDEAGNINYNVYGSVDFYAQTPAPGTPTALQIFDISNRDTQEYADSLKWTAPTSLGTGFNGYEVYRSSDNATFASVGTTSGTTYADTALQSQVYYYYLKSKDNAGQYSVASSTVSITPTGKYTSAPSISTQPISTPKAYSASVSWETDRESSSFIEYGSDKDHIGKEKGGKTIGALEQTKKHTVNIDGLQPETTYSYQSVWLDSDGNRGQSDALSFQTGLRPNISEVKVTNITLSSATISWTSTTIATSTLAYGKTTGYGQTAQDSSGSQTTSHTVNLSGLDDSSGYNFQISGQDTDGNTLTSDNYNFNTLVKPVVSNVRFESVKDAATSSVRFTWSTNVASTSIVYYTPAGGGTLSKSDADYKTSHDLTVANLADQSSYTLYVKSVDQYGNSAQSDSNTFTTPDDTRPPKVSNLSIEVKSAGFGETQKAQIVASWETDEPATSQIEYGPGISGTEYANKSKEDASLATSHVVIVSELEPSKIYHLKAVSRDNAKNQGASDDTTVITGKIQKSVIDIIINSLEKSLGWMFRIFK